MKSRSFILLLLITAFVSCKKENKEVKKENVEKEETKPNQVVLISVNAPSEYIHVLKQDSVGKPLKDSLGPKAFYPNHGFTYLDHMNNEQSWTPKPAVRDTIVIESYSEYLELATPNFFTSIKETFLVKNGDTVVFEYNNLIPKAAIPNRNTSEIELNYNRYRLRELFDNKYTSHFLIFGNLSLNDGLKNYEQNSIRYYNQAKEDYVKEVQLLDSLYASNTISKVNYQYRKDALDMLMEKHKRLKNIKKWLAQNRSLNNKEILEQQVGFDLSKTDSLMRYSFFRDYLNYISEYELKYIVENNGSSGGSYLDSRARFDSILDDSRFNQTAKNYLLFEAYHGIGRNFKVRDKQRYFEKLQEHTTNREKLRTLVREYKLDFSKSDVLVLTTQRKDTLTYAQILQDNKGKWLYIDFWASWCEPCRRTMPASKTLKQDLNEENIEFIYLSLGDKKEPWQEAIRSFGISGSQNYFIENGNVSTVIEDLGIKTIPHYLIYNPQGELVNGFANRPGKGAKKQLKGFMEVK